MKKSDDASAFLASVEGTSPERGGDSENDVRSGPRTSLGDGVVKPVGSRIEWAELLRRIYLVDVLACPCGGRQSIVADISDSEVVVAILAHKRLPPFAPPLARARSPGFDFTCTATARAAAEGATTSRGRRCAARTTCARFEGSLI
jgi:hypothetical protein